MRVDIRGLGFPLATPLLEHTERRLRFALTRTGARIRRVVVRLGYTNRPRGGEDRFCRIQVVLDGAQPVLIEDAGTDLYAVIDRAAERAGRNVAQNVAQLRENFRLGQPQLPASLPGESFTAMSNN